MTLLRLFEAAEAAQTRFLGHSTTFKVNEDLEKRFEFCGRHVYACFTAGMYHSAEAAEAAEAPTARSLGHLTTFRMNEKKKKRAFVARA